MDKKLKAKWVKALMSGEYRQGVDHLKKNGRYCCLGVLRDINDPTDKRHSDFLDFLNDEGLSEDQEKEFGLNYEIQCALAKLNDDRVPFPVIAGFIQENL